MSHPKLIKPLESYGPLSDDGFVSAGTAVYTGMKDNPHFPGPPVSPTDLKAGLDSLSALIALAKDGSKKVIAERKKQREAVTKMLRLDARYVEITSNGDMAIFKTSGYEPAPTTKAQPAPLPVPEIKSIDHGANTGQIDIQIKKVPKAQGYELQHASVPPGGLPTNWTKDLVPGVRKPTTVSGLTPGTVYAFQVRAFGKLGYTDWSSPVPFMCT
jgi:hypothetical protein